jgi:hypothetical protein
MSLLLTFFMSWVILAWLTVLPPLVHHPPRSHADAGGLDRFLPFIPGDAVPSLFEPFRRIKARTGAGDGVGLGLSIARSVLTAHHATVTASSQPGGGLHISVVIPRPQNLPAESQP